VRNVFEVCVVKSYTMLRGVSWASFIQFIVIGCALYYSAIFIKYYRKDFIVWMRRRSNRSKAS
jgi:hypothetical protein